MTATVIDGSTKAELKAALNDFPDWPHYVVIDGAQFTDLPGQLVRREERCECLFAGQMDVEVLAVAPYIVEVQLKSDTIDWVLNDLGKFDGLLFISTPRELMDIRRHLRKMALAEMPDGEVVFFRYYDPRTLKNLVPILDDVQKRSFFSREKDVVYHVVTEKGIKTFAHDDMERN